MSVGGTYKRAKGRVRSAVGKRQAGILTCGARASSYCGVLLNPKVAKLWNLGINWASAKKAFGIRGDVCDPALLIHPVLVLSQANNDCSTKHRDDCV